MWHKFNPNPRGSSVGDCAVRAVAAATGAERDAYKRAADILRNA